MSIALRVATALAAVVGEMVDECAWQASTDDSRKGCRYAEPFTGLLTD